MTAYEPQGKSFRHRLFEISVEVLHVLREDLGWAVGQTHDHMIFVRDIRLFAKIKGQL